MRVRDVDRGPLPGLPGRFGEAQGEAVREADFVIVGWRDDDGMYVVCASADLTKAEIETVRDLDAEGFGRLRGRPVRVTAQTTRYEFRVKAKTCYMALGVDYGSALVRLMESTNFNPDEHTERPYVDVEEAEVLALPVETLELMAAEAVPAEVARERPSRQ